MGCEDFQAVLSTDVSLRTALAVLRGNAHVRDDPGGGMLPDDVYLLFNEGQHILQIEVSRPADRTRISVRFAVCHPDSVDGVFIEFVKRLAQTLDASVSLMEDLEPGAQGDFEHADLAEFAACTKRTIAAKRALWQAEFGTERAAVTCEDAVRRFVIGAARDS